MASRIYFPEYMSRKQIDVLVDVIVKDLDELKYFLTMKLGKVKGIKNYDVSIIMDIYKRKLTYLIPPKFDQK